MFSRFSRVVSTLKTKKNRQNRRQSVVARDQPNSQEKMRDFTIEFLKCAKFHGKFMEGV